jgi:hypothetical protein
MKESVMQFLSRLSVHDPIGGVPKV